MQKEITQGSDLFDERGRLIQTGWARRLVMNYNREKMAASKLRLKEWDCYCILNPNFGLILIVADVGYFGMGTVDWLDFRTGEIGGSKAIRLFTRGQMNLPRTADHGDVYFSQKDCWIKFQRNQETGPRRELSFDFPSFKFRGKKGISGQVSLYQDPEMDTMVNVIPFKNPHHFVYVQKITCMPATGRVNIGGETFEFLGEENSSWGVLDWSRGVFPYRTEWWWAYASGRVQGKLLGFNIDYGFGTESNKSMIFYEGRGHHLDKVTYTFDPDNLMKPWYFTSNDGRVNLTLEPVAQQPVSVNALLLSTEGKHVYGFYSGDLVLDDGTVVHISPRDRLFGSAEYFRHRW